MNKRIVRKLMLVVCFVVLTESTSAQVSEKPFEVGGLVTVIGLKDFQSRLFSQSEADSAVGGFGGRFTYNINNNFAIDAEGSFFPKRQFDSEELGQKLQGFAGVKAGIRKKSFGVFAKARPGVMWFGDFPSRGDCNPTSFGSICGVSHEKNFALDLGGVIEFYPSNRLIIRGDIGDTIIHYQSRVVGPFTAPVVLGATTKNNLQLSLGVGWRF
jgi:Outer membrane protein beta-barrel domain